MSDVSFDVVAMEFPETDDDELNLVIMGYPWCPFSQKALNALKVAKDNGDSYLGDHSVFVEFDDRSNPKLLDFRRKAKYTGSMPVIFVRDAKSRRMSHVGGANEFVEHLKSHRHSKSRK